jgi:hypothetical protein
VKTAARRRTHRARQRPAGTGRIEASAADDEEPPVSLTQYYTATSLDGFIAGPGHSLDWLLSRDQDEAGPPNYADFIADVGALAMGRSTARRRSSRARRSSSPPATCRPSTRR